MFARRSLFTHPHSSSGWFHSAFFSSSSPTILRHRAVSIPFLWLGHNMHASVSPSCAYQSMVPDNYRPPFDHTPLHFVCPSRFLAKVLCKPRPVPGLCGDQVDEGDPLHHHSFRPCPWAGTRAEMLEVEKAKHLGSCHFAGSTRYQLPR